MIKDAVKAVLGVGTKSETKIKITPFTVICFALLVALLFLGGVSLLLLVTSLIVNS